MIDQYSIQIDIGQHPAIDILLLLGIVELKEYPFFVDQGFEIILGFRTEAFQMPISGQGGLWCIYTKQPYRLGGSLVFEPEGITIYDRTDRRAGRGDNFLHVLIDVIWIVAIGVERIVTIGQ